MQSTILAILVLLIILPLSWIFIIGRKSRKILICGISGAGKTHLFTILHPSFNSDKKMQFVTSADINESDSYIDLPGHPKLRYLHTRYLKTANRIIFCIDSTTFKINCNEIVEYLIQLLSNPLIGKLKILFLCTKSQSNGASPHESIKTLLENQM